MDLLSWTFANQSYDQDKPVLIDAANPSRSLSARQIRKAVRQVISGLRAAGLKEGDTVCVDSFNDIYYTVLFLGIIGAGGRFTGANPAHTVHEISHQLRICQAKFILTEPEMLARAVAAAKECELPTSKIFIFNVHGQEVPEGHKSWTDLLQHGENDWVRLEDNTKTVGAETCTSGTGGQFKAAMLSHSYLVTQAELRLSKPDLPYKPCRLICIPAFPIFAMPTQHAASIREGIPHYVMRRYDAQQVCEYVERYQITETYLAPPMLIHIPSSPFCTKEAWQSLRQIWFGGAAVNYANQQKLYKFLHPEARMYQCWGMTEAGWTTGNQWPEKDEDSSVGRPFAGFKLKIIDVENGTPITEDNKPGEVLIGGSSVMLGYLGNASSSADVFDSEGFLYSGDIGYVKDGKWFIIDRKKDLIKVRGWQVSPVELEGMLLQHPDIADAGVIGFDLPDGSSEEPRAFVVRREGTDIDEQGVKAFLKGRLSSYKIPTEVRFISAIPRNAGGKILRRVLKEIDA
ncbi:MAG: hypothetical protein M1827_002151 [Pycnora praestabilis]|nr:MAG: hypothetical protein M1827_002151 [Pycnora praestabilis]